jgi:hypothetical protein
MNTLACYFKRSEIFQIFPVHATSTKYVNSIVDERCSMTLPRRRDKPNALQLRPLPSIQFEGPCVIVMMRAISSTETAALLTSLPHSTENGGRT